MERNGVGTVIKQNNHVGEKIRLPLYKDLNKDFTREEIVEQFPGAKTSPLLLGRKICCSQGYFTTHWKGFLGTQNAFSAP